MKYLVGALAAAAVAADTPVVVCQTFLASTQNPNDGSAPCKLRTREDLFFVVDLAS